MARSDVLASPVVIDVVEGASSLPEPYRGPKFHERDLVSLVLKLGMKFSSFQLFREEKKIYQRART